MMQNEKPSTSSDKKRSGGQKLLLHWTKRNLNAYILAGTIIVGYAIAMLPNILSSNYAPDEIWFSNEAHQFDVRLRQVGVWRYVIEQPNHLGYGPLYWIIQTFFSHFFSNALVASRLFSLLCLVIVPLALVVSRERSMTIGKWLALILWLTFPAAWWTGKLTGPELPSLAAGAAGLACLTRHGQKSRLAGWWLLGIALGIKATAAPLLLFAAILTGKHDKSWAKRALAAIVCTSLGLVTSSPVLLVAPQRFLHTLRMAKGAGPLNIQSWNHWWQHVALRINTNNWTWDGLPNGGLMQWSLGAVPLSVFMAMVWWEKDRWRVGAAFFAAASLSVTLCLTSPQYWGWYWFGTLLIFPFSWIAQTQWSLVNGVFASLLVLANAAYNLPTIKDRYASKMGRQFITESKTDIQKCVEEAAGTMRNIDTVLDYSELYLDLDFDFLVKRGSLDRQGIVPLMRVAFWLMGHQPLPPLGNEVLMVINEKLREVHAPKISAREVASRVAGAHNIEFVRSCSTLQLYRFGLEKS